MNDDLRTNDPTRVPAETSDETALTDETTLADQTALDDEARRGDDLAPTGQDAPAGAPTGLREWDREEWAGDNQRHRADVDEVVTPATEAAAGFPKWNEHQVVGEGQGGPDEGPDERVLPTEGDSEYSGHGHNPGGGERWAQGNIDRERRP